MLQKLSTKYLHNIQIIIPKNICMGRLTFNMEMDCYRPFNLLDGKEQGGSAEGYRKWQFMGSCYRFCTKKSSGKFQNIVHQANNTQELVDRIVGEYNYQQYKIPSAAALLQLHNHYKIFKQGDRILDIGAGPHYSWSKLALKLSSPSLLISNDLSAPSMPVPKGITPISGSFLEQQVQTSIALHLQQAPLDTILIDATGQFTGSLHNDSAYTMNIFVNAMNFGRNYLKKGGTIVLRVVDSVLSRKNQYQAKFFFQNVQKFRSSSFRVQSPSVFYVMRGFMMSLHLAELQKFFLQYHKASNSPHPTETKTKILQQHKDKHFWSPTEMILSRIKQQIMQLKKTKRNIQILQIYENQPENIYSKIKQILSLLDIIEKNQKNQKDKDQNGIGVLKKIKAERRLQLGDQADLQQQIDLPENQEQFAQMLYKQVERLQKQQKQAKQLRKLKLLTKKQRDIILKNKKNKIQQQKKKTQIDSKAPLGQNQVYLKSTKISQKQLQQENKSQPKKLNYFPEDLYGFNPDNPEKSIMHIEQKYDEMGNKKDKRAKGKKGEHVGDLEEDELYKMMKSFPQIKEAFQNNQKMKAFQEGSLNEEFLDKIMKNKSSNTNFKKFQQKLQQLFSKPYQPKSSSSDKQQWQQSSKQLQQQQQLLSSQYDPFSSSPFPSSRQPTPKSYKINKQKHKQKNLQAKERELREMENNYDNFQNKYAGMAKMEKMDQQFREFRDKIRDTEWEMQGQRDSQARGKMENVSKGNQKKQWKGNKGKKNTVQNARYFKIKNKNKD